MSRSLAQSPATPVGLRGMCDSADFMTVGRLGRMFWTGGGFLASWVGEVMQASACFRQSRWHGILHSAAEAAGGWGGVVHTQGVGWSGTYTGG